MLERDFLIPSKTILETSISPKDEDSNFGSLHLEFSQVCSKQSDTSYIENVPFGMLKNFKNFFCFQQIFLASTLLKFINEILY